MNWSWVFIFYILFWFINIYIIDLFIIKRGFVYIYDAVSQVNDD